MATRLFSDLINRITPSAPGCPQPVVIEAARNAAIEVCAKTLAWRFIHDTITMVDGQYTYAFVPPDADSEVHAVITASRDGVKFPAITHEQAFTMYPFWPTTAAVHRSQPQYLVHSDTDNFNVAPTPDGVETYALNLVVALKPLVTATGMDKSTLDDIEDVVVHGALQRLLVMPERTWSDREGAAYHAKQYSFKTAERRARANLGVGRASLTVRMTPLA